MEMQPPTQNIDDDDIEKQKPQELTPIQEEDNSTESEDPMPKITIKKGYDGGQHFKAQEVTITYLPRAGSTRQPTELKVPTGELLETTT